MGIKVQSAPVTGIELGYAENTAGVSNITSTTYADITGLAITIGPTNRPAMIELHVPQVDNGTAGQTVFLQIIQAGVKITEGYMVSAASLSAIPFTLRRRVPILGAATLFKAQVRVGGGAGELQPRGGAIHLSAVLL